MVNRFVRTYCKEAVERLKSATFDEKQQLSRELVQTAVFEGERVRIRGAIPAGDSSNAELDSRRPVPEVGAWDHGLSRRIATPMIYRRGRNPGREDRTEIQYGEQETTVIRFELTPAIPRTLEIRSKAP